jgi:hypothetical protein
MARTIRSSSAEALGLADHDWSIGELLDVALVTRTGPKPHLITVAASGDLQVIVCLVSVFSTRNNATDGVQDKR